MIQEQDKITQYLEQYHAGNILMGLDVGIPELDDAIRYKQGQFNVILGLDNVGKTAWILWYMLCLSVKHNLRWAIWSGENEAGELVSQLIEFMVGKKLQHIDNFSDVVQLELKISKWFTFIDNSKQYTAAELFDLFKESGCNGALIDPFTGLNRAYTHAANYEFLNESRHFCNTTGITIYLNTHPVSEAARREYPKGHEWEGYQMPPNKAQCEGGQGFANRCSDFITIHRLVGHPVEQYNTQIYVRKVKNIRTGGQVTDIANPIECYYNSGLGFTINGNNPLNFSNTNHLELNNNTILPSTEF
jgi:hypothetical protein